MNKYSKLFDNDNNNTQIQELKAAIKQNRDKSMHVRYMVIYQHLKVASNINISQMFNIDPHTVGIYIKK